jgi:hypothetical protein
MKAASPQGSDFPHPPNAFAFVIALVENIVLADVTLCPITFAVLNLIFAFHDEFSDAIAALTGEDALAKGQIHFHRMSTGLNEIPGPRPAGKAGIGFQVFRNGRLCLGFIVSCHDRFIVSPEYVLSFRARLTKSLMLGSFA